MTVRGIDEKLVTVLLQLRSTAASEFDERQSPVFEGRLAESIDWPSLWSAVKLPGVHHLNANQLKVPHIAGRQGQAMHQGCRSDKRIALGAGIRYM